MSAEQTTVKKGIALDRKIISRLAQYIKPHWPAFAITLLLIIAAEFLVSMFPKILQLAIDGPIKNKDFSGLIELSLIFIGLMFAAFVIGSSAMYLANIIAQKVVHLIRTQMMVRAQKLSLSYFNRTPVGVLMSRMTSDVDLLQELFSDMFLAIIGSCFTIVFIMFFMISISLKLSLTLLLILPPLILITLWFKEHNRNSFIAIRGLNAKIMSFIQENVNGMRIVQLFGREKKNLKDFDVVNARYRDEYLKTVEAYSRYFPTIDFLNLCSLVLITVVGGKMYLDGSITIGALPAFMVYMFMFVEPLRRIAERYSNMQHAMAAAERVFALLDNKEIREDKGTFVLKQDTIQGKVEFKNVNFGYKKDVQILTDINFSIEPGERIAIVGATGSGKTTTINLLNRFYDPWNGSISLDDIPLAEYTLASLRAHIGVISQDHFLFSRTVAQNISMDSTDITQERIERVCREINIHDFIMNLPKGYETLLGQEGQALSVGQRQLIAFARVLAFDPKILILDEATSSIDSASEQLILNALGTLMKGRTTIAIAHRLSTIKMVDRILLFHKGEIREKGTHEELLRENGIYATLYELQLSPENI